MDKIKNNNNQNLAIYQKYMELIYYTNNIVKKYPKTESFTSVREIKAALFHGLKLLIYAIKKYNKKDKLNYLNELDIHLTIIKVHMRLSYKSKYINIQNYTTWSNLITDINNMLGAWISSCLKK